MAYPRCNDTVAMILNPLTFLSKNNPLGQRAAAFFALSGGSRLWEAGQEGLCSALLQGKYCVLHDTITPAGSGAISMPHGGGLSVDRLAAQFQIGKSAIPAMSTLRGCCVPPECAAQKEQVAQLLCPIVSAAGATSPIFVGCAEATSWDGGAKAVFALCMIIVSIVILTSLFRWFLDECTRSSFPSQLQPNDQHEPPRDYSDAIWNDFSLQHNWDLLRSSRPIKKANAPRLQMLDGMRCLSMAWVVLGHSHLFIFPTMWTNIMTIAPTKYDSVSKTVWFNMFILGGTFSVDSFFWLSGFLASYIMIRVVSKIVRNGRPGITQVIWIPITYLQRYLRLTPSVLMAILIFWKLMPLLGEGVLKASSMASYNSCAKLWWKNILYIQNAYDMGGPDSNGSCMGHFWYLMVDMQLFYTLPFLVWIYVQRKKGFRIAAFTIVSLLILICMIINGSLAHKYGYTANMFQTAKTGNSFDLQYDKPWTRMGAYYAGVLLSFTFDTWYEAGYGRSLSRWVSSALQSVALGIMFVLLVAPANAISDPPQSYWSTGLNSFYNAVFRTFWGLCLSLLFFATVETKNPRVGVIEKLMTFSWWTPLAKLTYAAYIIHFPVMGWHAAQYNSSPVQYTPYSQLMFFLGYLAVAESCAAVWFLFFEQPLANVCRRLINWIRGGQKKGKQVERPKAFVHSPVRYSDQRPPPRSSLQEGNSGEGTEDGRYSELGATDYPTREGTGSVA